MKISRDILLKLYFKRVWSQTTIAKHFNCSQANISLYFKKYHIKSRTYSERRKGKKHTEKTKRKISESNIATRKTNLYKYCGKNNSFYGKHHSEFTKEKIKNSEYHKNLKRENNPNFNNHVLKGKFTGHDSPNWKGSLPKCQSCGKRLSHYQVKNYCKICYRGLNHQSYIHGNGNLPYSVDFNHKLKQKIRERNSFKCQKCGLKESNHYRGQKRINLTIHHVDYNKQNSNEQNLITLCHKCNIKTNTQRDYWYAYYKYIMENR